MSVLPWVLAAAAAESGTGGSPVFRAADFVRTRGGIEGSDAGSDARGMSKRNFPHGRAARATSDAGDATADQFRATAYASYQPNALFYADLQLSGGYSANDARRRLTAEFDDVGVRATRTYKASPDGTDITFATNAGLRLPLRRALKGRTDGIGSIHLTPWLGLQYTHASVDGFTEQSRDAGRLTVSGYEQDSVLARFGVGADWRLLVLDRPLTLALNAAYSRELADHDTALTARYTDLEAALPTTLRVNTTPETLLQFGPSATYTLTPALTLRATYLYETSLHSHRSHHLTATLTYRF